MKKAGGRCFIVEIVTANTYYRCARLRAKYSMRMELFNPHKPCEIDSLSPSFSGEENEAQKGELTWPRSSS